MYRQPDQTLRHWGGSTAWHPAAWSPHRLFDAPCHALPAAAGQITQAEGASAMGARSITLTSRDATRLKLERVLRILNRRHGMLVAMVSASPRDPVMRHYADALTAFRRTGLRSIRVRPEPVRGAPEQPLAWTAELDAALGGRPLDLLLLDWPAGGLDELPRVLASARALNAPAVIIRQTRLTGIRRVLVATAEGPHTLQLLWVARAAAQSYGVPVRAVRMDTSRAGGSPASPAGSEAVGPSLLGLTPAVAICASEDPADGLVRLIRPGDLLVLGAPHPLRHTTYFQGSIPERIARRTDAPLMLLLSRRPARVDLRRLFWGPLIQVGLRPRDARDAIGRLLDVLVQHHQVPASSRADLLSQAMERERRLPTTADCDTAFPHIVKPGLLGMLGAMAICPEGVSFGGAGSKPTHFIFLFITPEGFYDEYLETLGRIARRMIRPELRAALLECPTPQAALEILEPHPNPGGEDIAGMPGPRTRVRNNTTR